MSRLLSKHAPSKDGRIQHITPESAGWKYVGFDVYQLEEGQTLTLPADDKERCLVLVSGRASVVTPAEKFEHIGQRMSPFERIPAWSVYVPHNTPSEVKAETALELAVCSAPGFGKLPARLIAPKDVGVERRGKGRNRRLVHNILPGDSSSYPSHKHDTPVEGKETYLEETYYHRFDPPQGFALHRVYTDDRSLDECMAPYDRDVVQVPRGYHPVATIAGYDNYYLNVMAGPERKWQFTWEKDHAWVNSDQYPRNKV
jgi:5-deoxy-glucuronate isomerase